MDRRKALKNISLAFTGLVATPTLVQILNSCSEKKYTEPYLFLKDSQPTIIEQLAKFILPETYFEHSSKLNYARFLDEMYFHTVSEADKKLFDSGCKAFEKVFSKTYGKNASEGSQQEYDLLLKRYFDVTEKKQKEVFSLLQQNFDSIDASERSDYLCYHFLSKTRHYCLFGYCTSEAYANSADFQF